MTITSRYLLLGGALVCIVLAGCAPKEIVLEPSLLAEPEEEPFIPIVGVDSIVTAEAYALADSAIVSPGLETQSQQSLMDAENIITMVDSLLAPSEDIPPLPEGADTTSLETQNAAIDAFNEGATILSSLPNETTAVDSLLVEAQGHLEESLNQNPWEADARYWLGHVYQMRATQLGEKGLLDEAIAVLQRLLTLHPDRHDYVALLAEVYEKKEAYVDLAAAGELWSRSASLAVDDAVLATTEVYLDSTLVWNYYARSSQAFIGALDDVFALEKLDSTEQWARTPEEKEFVHSEREWVLWDNGNIPNRLTWDSLLVVGSSTPGEALPAMGELLPHVTKLAARLEIRHHIALLNYTEENHAVAITLLQELWHETREDTVSGFQERIREDYGTLSFNLATLRIKEGERRVALAYLLQSEKTGWEGAPRAAYQTAILLRNNVPEALKPALRAEEGFDQLQPEEQRELLRYFVYLYRKLNQRDEAAAYLQRFRAMERTGSNAFSEMPSNKS